MAKRPIPSKPTVEKVKRDTPEFDDPLSDDPSNKTKKKSKKKFLTFFFILMIAFCGGGYGYIEYKKMNAKEAEVIKTDPDKENPEKENTGDLFADADPDGKKAQTDNSTGEKNSEVPESELIVPASNENEVNNEEIAEETELAENSDPNTNDSDSEEITFDLSSDDSIEPTENITEETKEEPIEDISLDLESSTEEEIGTKTGPFDENKPDEKEEDFFEASSTLDKKDSKNDSNLLNEDLIEEDPEIKTEDKTAENKEETDFETLVLEEDKKGESPEEFLEPKQAKSVEEVNPRSKPVEKVITQRKPARKPPKLNSERPSRKYSQRRTRTDRSPNRNSPPKMRWKLVGEKVYQTPEGLIYGPGSREGHRMQHVLRHAKDQPNRSGKHGVFQVKNGDELFLLIDEVYQIAKKRGPPVDIKNDRNRTVYTVKMNRNIGYIGGKEGARRKHPPARSVRIVLEGKKVITAFPM